MSAIHATPTRLIIVDSGFRLWVTDGTPGAEVQLGAVTVSNVAIAGESIFFAGTTAGSDNEPWWSDGTPAGTARLRDVAPGPTGSGLSDACVLGDRVYFIADDVDHGREIWSTDGTSAGTQLLDDLAPGPGDALGRHGVLFAAADRLVFLRSDAARGKLCTSDGTAAGTRCEDTPCSGSPSYLGRPGAIGDDALVPLHCWCSRMLLRSGDSGSPALLAGGAGPEAAVLGDRIVTMSTAGTQGAEPAVIDARDGSFLLLADADPAKSGTAFGQTVDWAGRLAFAVDDNCPSVHESGLEALWISGGTAETTSLAWETREAGVYGAPQELTVMGDRLFFVSRSEDREALVALDGRGPREIATAAALAYDHAIKELTTVGNDLYFLAWADLYRSDGTAPGTGQVGTGTDWFWSNSFQPMHWGDRPHALTAFGDRLLFAHRPYEYRPGISDGTGDGFTSLMDVGFQHYHMLSPRFAILDDQAIFLSSSLGHNGESTLVWRTRGERNDAEIIATLDGDWNYSPYKDPPLELLAMNGVAYFVGRTEAEGRELWRTDGTAVGTWLVVDLWPGPDSGRPEELTVAGDILYFRARDEEAGWELWRSDGTAAGTHRLVDALPGPRGSRPEHLRAMGRSLVFAAHDDAHGQEPWVSDGTAAGTRRVSDLQPGPAASMPSQFTVSGGLVYFTADDGVHGRELWAMDLDGDLDGIADSMDPCPLQEESIGNDADADGVMDLCDLAPADAAVTRPPRAIENLRVARHGTRATLTWRDESSWSGPAIRYDILEGAIERAAWQSVLAGASCTASGHDRARLDVDATGDRWYLVRGRFPGLATGTWCDASTPEAVRGEIDSGVGCP